MSVTTRDVNIKITTSMVYVLLFSSSLHVNIRSLKQTVKTIPTLLYSRHCKHMCSHSICKVDGRYSNMSCLRLLRLL